MDTKKDILLLCLFGLLSVALFIVNILLGTVEINLSQIINALQNPDDNKTIATILFEYRLPQSVTALLAGASLATAGLMMQTLFRNPLADPSILGISSGASLGVALIILISGSTGLFLSSSNLMSSIGVTSAAFIGSTITLLIIAAIGRRVKSMATLIIVGILIAFFVSSLTDILKFFSNKDDLRAFVVWGFGSFDSVGQSNLSFFSIALICGLFATFFLSRCLDLLLIGESYAENLGLNVRRTTFLTILLAGFLTAVVTAFCGPIAFVGLAVPHLARYIFRTSSHSILLPASMLIGATLTLLCNLISRLPSLDSNLPINAVTALIGAPIILHVIWKRSL